jgi:hypothetical protein
MGRIRSSPLGEGDRAERVVEGPSGAPRKGPVTKTGPLFTLQAKREAYSAASLAALASL